VGDNVYVRATVRNLHETNTVNFPAIKLTVPESFFHDPSDGCDYSANVVTCELLALPPLSESQTVFELIGKTLDPQVTIFGSVNSTQPDSQSQNNESHKSNVHWWLQW